MISVNRRTLYGEVFNDVRCLSSDEKPTEGIKNGSTLIEIDTGARYLFDASNGQWNEFSQGGGGGGEYVLPTMSPTTKGGATVGEGLTMDGTALSVDFTEVASVDALEEATALSPTGGIVSTQDGLAVSPTQQTDGAIDGALLELTAKSKPATQQSTTGKNLLPNTATSQTVNGVTFTVNADGSVTANGTASAQIDFYITGMFSIDAGTYYMSGSPIGSSSTTYFLYEDVSGRATYHEGRLLEVSDTTQLRCRIVIRQGVTVSNLTFYPQLELGSTATPYEPYTGGAPFPSPDYPQPIITVRGRNLIDEEESEPQYITSDGSLSTGSTSGQNFRHTSYIRISPGTSYYAALPSTTGSIYCAWYDADKNLISTIHKNDYANKSITAPSNAIYIRISYKVTDSGKVQLTLGSTPQPYVPYGYVGLERRDSQGTLLDTTPIPLPSRGWVAGLPDGTADELSVDGAGKVVWDCKTDETTTAATDGITGIVGVDVMSTTGQIADGATVLYKHSTTEDCGYVNFPSMQDCVLSIPELDALGVRYTIGDGAEIARQWYERAYSEYEQRIADLEEAVAELTAGA